MIRKNTINCKLINIKNMNFSAYDIYNNAMDDINLDDEICPSCGLKGGCSPHASYSRYLIDFIGNNIEYRQIEITRVICDCGSTHAILPECIVPYSQIPADTQQQLADPSSGSPEIKQTLELNPDITESDAYHVRKMFKKHWQQRLLVIGLILSTPIQELIRRSFSQFHRQFMQIRRGENLLFFTTNTG